MSGCDGPGVAVLDPAAAGLGGEAAVVAAGDDAVADAGGAAVGERDLGGLHAVRCRGGGLGRGR